MGILAKRSFSYQSLIFERIINTPEEEPEGPEVLEAKLQKMIRHKNQSPKQQKLDVDQSAERKKRGLEQVRKQALVTKSPN